MILLDTHIWHWWVNQIPGKLPRNTITLIEEAETVSISAISCFEMAWLVRHGRIDLGMSFDSWFEEAQRHTDIRILPVTAPIGIQAVALPEHHKDPQDRIIIATALLHNANLVSFDTAFPAYQELHGRLIGQ
jgi:PIN domain nuclease of toxin-antitoxin system